IQGTDLRRNAQVFDFIQLRGGSSEEHVYTTAIDSKVALDWYSTGRIRIGHTLGDRIMVFGTAGGVVGLTEVSEVTAVNENTRFGGQFSDQFSNNNRDIRGGWTGGGGFDFCLTPHIILNFTYLYIDLGDESAQTNVAFLSGVTARRGGQRSFESDTRVRADFKFHVFQGGISFKF